MSVSGTWIKVYCDSKIKNNNRSTHSMVFLLAFQEVNQNRSQKTLGI
jgi:hypothetical protein